MSEESLSIPPGRHCKPTHVTSLEFSSASEPSSRRSLDSDSLTLILRDGVKETNDLCGRLLIAEDLSADVVETLGSLLNIDPLFFVSHIEIF